VERPTAPRGVWLVVSGSTVELLGAGILLDSKLSFLLSETGLQLPISPLVPDELDECRGAAKDRMPQYMHFQRVECLEDFRSCFSAENCSAVKQGAFTNESDLGKSHL